MSENDRKTGRPTPSKTSVKRIGLESWTVESYSGDDAFRALQYIAEGASNAPSGIEAEARDRERIAKERLAYLRRRLDGKANLDEDEARVARFFECADEEGYNRFPGPGVFPEGSYDRLLAEWLGLYREYRAAIASNDALRAGDIAFRLGSLTQINWWRFGKDPETGRRREDLARVKKKMQLADLPNATRARREQAENDPPEWHEWAQHDAEEIWKAHPSYSKIRVAMLIHEKWTAEMMHARNPAKCIGKHRDKVPSVRAIRGIIDRP